MTVDQEKLVGFLSRHDWYHQRFTGAPFFLGLIAEAELRYEERKNPGSVHTWRLCFFENTKADWYILRDDLKKTADVILNETRELKDRRAMKDYVKNKRSLWREDEKRFYDECKKLDTYDFAHVSVADLSNLLSNLKSSYINAISASSFIDGFVLETDERFSEALKSQLKKANLADRFSGYFSILSEADSLSFLAVMELNLMSIALEIRKNQQLTDVFYDLEGHDLMNVLRDRYSIFYHLLQEHQAAYFWVKNNYATAHYLSLDYFLGELKNLVADRFLVKKQQTLFEKMELTDLRKSKILEEIDADTELIALVYLSSAISVWQDDRKKMTFFATHYFTLILERVARYFACTLEELKYLTCLEVENLLANDRALSFPLNRRVQNCAFVWHESSVDVFTDEDLISTLKDTVRVKDDFILNELKGLIASPGKVVGRVRVLDVIEKLDDFENDEILVAVMTRPDFLSAMKKAKAIVTDEGGVTSHAAVLSREFNIPCVVGTKMATNYLRDGDFVEVDAFNGIVKKLPN